MNQSAKVTSIEAVRALRAAIVKFEGGAQDAVTSLELEVRRAVDWIEVDRRRYWPSQVKQASEELVEARNALERCQLKYGSEEAPSCYEQKKNYQKAKQRLRHCEDQVRKVKQWTQILRQELTKFDSQIAQMTICIDSDLPRAISALTNMLAALERYAGTTAAPMQQTSSTTGDTNHDAEPKDTSEA